MHCFLQVLLAHDFPTLWPLASAAATHLAAGHHPYRKCSHRTWFVPQNIENIIHIPVWINKYFSGKRNLFTYTRLLQQVHRGPAALQMIVIVSLPCAYIQLFFSCALYKQWYTSLQSFCQHNLDLSPKYLFLLIYFSLTCRFLVPTSWQVFLTMFSYTLWYIRLIKQVESCSFKSQFVTNRGIRNVYTETKRHRPLLSILLPWNFLTI